MDEIPDLSIDVEPALPPCRGDMRSTVDRIDRRYVEAEALKGRTDLDANVYHAWQNATADDLEDLFWTDSVARAVRSGMNMPSASGLREMVDERRHKLLNVMAQIILNSFSASRADIAAGNASVVGDAAVLLMHVGDARIVLTRQIQRGEKLRAKFLSQPGTMPDSRYQEVSAEERRYREYNLHLLKLIFDRGSVAKEFNDRTTPFEWAAVHTRTDFESLSRRRERVGSDPQETLRQRVDRQIQRLTDLRDTIHLRPVPMRKVFDDLPNNATSGAREHHLKESRVFVVHGHHVAYREALARMLERFGIDAVILDEQPNAGATIVEKLEREAASVGYVIVLATADDLGQRRSAGRNAGKSRARQNVIFELGYFVGKLGRDRVCLLLEPTVEIFSDFAGVAYHALDEGGTWKFRVATELKKAGFAIDLNTLAAR